MVITKVLGSILPTVPVASPSTNHKLPSLPVVMAEGKLAPAGKGNSVMIPPVVICPMELVWAFVYHRFPSGPEVMPNSALPVPLKKYGGTRKSVSCPLGVNW